MIYQYQTNFDVDKLASSMLQVGSFDAEILSLERLNASLERVEDLPPPQT